ncbi:MAG: hypothetical protein VYD45_03115, partial [Pseudomonadota bacterium]|nr:hypothetical protein [Pseudomonadota bacterium]
LALLGLVLGFGEGDLIHGSNESYRFGDGCIIADFGELFRPSLDMLDELKKSILHRAFSGELIRNEEAAA